MNFYSNQSSCWIDKSDKFTARSFVMVTEGYALLSKGTRKTVKNPRSGCRLLLSVLVTH